MLCHRRSRQVLSSSRKPLDALCQCVLPVCANQRPEHIVQEVVLPSLNIGSPFNPLLHLAPLCRPHQRNVLISPLLPSQNRQYSIFGIDRPCTCHSGHSRRQLPVIMMFRNMLQHARSMLVNDAPGINQAHKVVLDDVLLPSVRFRGCFSSLKDSIRVKGSCYMQFSLKVPGQWRLLPRSFHPNFGARGTVQTCSGSDGCRDGRHYADSGKHGMVQSIGA